MIKTAKLTPEESIQAQLKDYTLEVGTTFEDSSKEAVERLLRYTTPRDIVDLGCGDGAATKYLPGRVTGVDVNPEKLKLNPAAETVNKDMISYLKSQPDNSVPNIFCHHALEHLPNPQDALDLMGQKLAPGGYVYIEVPSMDEIHSVHHATFDEPLDLLPPGLEIVDLYSSLTEHYMISRKP